MADIAVGKPSASAKLRELATQIKAAQDPEIHRRGAGSPRGGLPPRPLVAWAKRWVRA